jgi:AcrR family transcriptional regulator
MNKAKSKYFNTASLMDQALLLLLEKKPFEYITVKEVCEKAGVNRSTFYLHYETMADLANECLQNATEQMQKKYDRPHSFGQFDIAALPLDELNLVTPKYLRTYLEFVLENKQLYKAVLSQPAVFYAEQRFSELYQGIFYPILERYHFPDWEKKYRISFYIKGLWAIVEEWLRADCADDIEKVMQVLMSCVYGAGR